MPEAFLAFPSAPSELYELLTTAAAAHNKSLSPLRLRPWTDLDVSGRPLHLEILAAIARADLTLIDVSILNHNVLFELGYAIGLGKPIRCILNPTYAAPSNLRVRTGLFDTIGWHEYSNASDLLQFIGDAYRNAKPLHFDRPIDRNAPVFLLDAYHKSPLVTHIEARIKKRLVHYRSYDPIEKARLTLDQSLRDISSSIGVIVPFVPETYPDGDIHNLRAAFITGLATGMEKHSLFMQLGDTPLPLDYRDMSEPCYTEAHIAHAIDAFALRILPIIQSLSSAHKVSGQTLLESIQLGDSVAENEFRNLPLYYLRTDAYSRAESGHARVVIGRKGAGKTALFVYLREQKRRNSNNVVVDLKPEGYQLLKFKEEVLSLLQEGTLEHVVTALWDYVLLLEIAYKLLEDDRTRCRRDHRIFEHYERLRELYHQESYYTEGDFSERLAVLLDRMKDTFRDMYGNAEKVRLNTPQVTELIYRHPVQELRDCLVQYLKEKDELWILIDNVDKGWPSAGLTPVDAKLVRCLIDGASKLKRHFTNQQDIPCWPVVFLRNDVYELLVEHSTDRGKVSVVSVDCADPEILKNILRKRLEFSGLDGGLRIEEMWVRICVSEVGDQSSLNYIIERCMMRPRALIDYVLACKARAVNREHVIIEEDDIVKGTENYSIDLIENLSLEIRDVAPDVANALYMFIGKGPVLSLEEIRDIALDGGIAEDRIVEFIIHSMG